MEAGDTYVVSTTSQFAEDSNEPVKRIHAAGFTFVPNPFGRRLTSSELSSLLNRYRPVALLAGVERIDRDALQAASTYLKVISRVGVGIDNIDVSVANRLGIKIYTTDNILSPAVAEFTLASIFNLARKISLHDRLMHDGKWHKYSGTLIREKTIGILGYGRIGKQVGQMLHFMGCKLLAYDPYVSEEQFTRDSVTAVPDMATLFAQSDIISVHLSADVNTQRVISKSIFDVAKPGLLLVNTSRGSVLDENALFEAVSSGRVAGAALDVFEQEPYNGPLSKLDNVVLTPHIASNARETRQKMELMAVDNFLGHFNAGE